MKHPKAAPYLTYSELQEQLTRLAESAPHLVSLSCLGTSFEGREISLVTVAGPATHADGSAVCPSERPALWIDGNLHATELAPTNACLGLVEHLVEGYGTDEEVTRALTRNTFYVCPRINPDGAELALAERPSFIRSSTRPWPPFLGEARGLVLEDIDGDGRILMMRQQDPDGAWKASEQDPRLMIRRDPAEDGGVYYRLLPEGRLPNYDGVNVRQRARTQGLDLNRNFPSGWRVEAEQMGAGPYPGSEPETRAIIDFISTHPNITGALTFHTHCGLLLRPFSHRSDEEFETHDLKVFEMIGRVGETMTGYPAKSVFHGFRYDPKGVITGAFDDWCFEHLGIFGWTIEIWNPMRAAGIEIPDEDVLSWYREHPIDDDLAMMAWNDRELGGEGYVDWYPFEHPELGPIELGGWHDFVTHRNPPAKYLDEEVARFPKWVLFNALISPKLAWGDAEVTRLGAGAYKVRVTVRNSGYLPTSVTRHADAKGLVPGVICSIEVPAGCRVGDSMIELGQLAGRSEKPSTPRWYQADLTHDRATAEWVVRRDGASGLTVCVRAHHPRAGTIVTRIALEP